MAGPPPELTPSLADPLPPRRARRRLVLAAALAAALALAAFGAGYVAGSQRAHGFETDFALAMWGTEAAPRAQATLVLGEIDEAGNWPMEMTIEGLPQDGRYELLLTRGGEPAASCGTFLVSGRTVVFLNAPYRLRQFDGWVITREGDRDVLLRTDDV